MARMEEPKDYHFVLYHADGYLVYDLSLRFYSSISSR